MERFLPYTVTILVPNRAVNVILSAEVCSVHNLLLLYSVLACVAYFVAQNVRFAAISLLTAFKTKSYLPPHVLKNYVASTH